MLSFEVGKLGKTPLNHLFILFCHLVGENCDEQAIVSDFEDFFEPFYNGIYPTPVNGRKLAP